MNKKQDLRYRGAGRLLAFLLMLAVSVGVVFLAFVWYNEARVAYLNPSDDVSVPVAGARAIEITAQEKETYGLESASLALNAAGEPIGFILITTVRGYKSDVRVQSTFAADGETLAGIEVLSQDETEYLGARIQSEGFVALFAGRRAPMKLWGAAVNGSPIDALSGATISSQAVVDAVNNAHAYLKMKNDE